MSELRETLCAQLPGIELAEEQPVFEEAWQAEAFALVLRLHEAGYFSWQEWTEALVSAINAAQSAGDPDLGDTYYQHWLRALEQLCADKHMVSETEARTRKEAWRQAYLHTPHGEPVTLK